MKNSRLKIFFLLIVGCLVPLFFQTQCTPKEIKGGRVQRFPSWGIVIESDYNPKLDSVIPGYKVIAIALTNRSFDLIRMDLEEDRWFVEDATGKRHKAILSLQRHHPDLWNQLPEKVKEIMDYPAGVPMGHTQFFYLFLPEKIDLYRFRSVGFYLASLKQNFDALSRPTIEKAIPVSDGQDSSADPKYTPRPKKSDTDRKKSLQNKPE